MINFSQLALILALVSAVLHAANNALLKKSAERLLLRAWIGLGSACMVVPFIFFVPFPPGHIWIWLGLSGTIHFVYQMLLINSYRLADLSVVYPVARGISPVLITIGAFFFLQEEITWQTGGGISFITGGILLLAVESTFKTTVNSTSLRMGVFLAFLTGIAITSYTLVDAHGIRLSDNLWSYVLWYFLVSENTLMLAYLFYRYPKNLFQKLWPYKKIGAVAAILSLGSYGLAMLAFRFGYASQVTAMRETSIIFGTFLGIFVLKERCTIPRILASILVVSGCIITRL